MSIFKKLKSLKIKQIIIIFLILIIILLAAVIKIFPFNQPGNSPEETITNAIEQIKNSPAISFTTVSMLNVNGNQREYGEITGELLKNGDFHIQGSILGSDLDLYQINNSTYRLDNISKNWQKTDENPEMYRTSLFNETNPLEQFNITDLGTVEKAQGNEKNLFGFTFMPTLSDNSISRYFTDITYTVYCDHDGNLKKTVVNGILTNNSVSGKLNIVTEFSPLPNDYQIAPPIIE